MRTITLLPLAALVAACASPESTKSLAERRLETIKGTNEGIKVLDLGATPAKPGEPPAAATPAAAKSEQPRAAEAAREPVEEAAKESVKEAAKPADNKPGFLGNLPPPSGKPINAARRGEGEGVGVPLPSSKPASAAEPKK
jgi:hypothetical protein